VPFVVDAVNVFFTVKVSAVLHSPLAYSVFPEHIYQEISSVSERGRTYSVIVNITNLFLLVE